jgi:peptide/nickel transport system substrate-binding protein
LSEEEGGGGPNVDRVVFRSIPDNTARVAALSGGELSAADGLTPDDVPTIEEDPNLKVITRPPLNVGYLAMNNEKKPFDDPKVRQAVVHAIDMQKIVDGFFGNTADRASNPMPPTVPFFNEDIDPYEFDPDMSRQLLEEAGFPDGFETNLWYMPIPRPYMPDGKGIAQAMQQDLNQVGIKATLETREWGTYLEETGSGAHDMALLGWTGDNGDPDNFINVLLASLLQEPRGRRAVANGRFDYRRRRATGSVHEGAGNYPRGRAVGGDRLRRAAAGLPAERRGLPAEPDRRRAVQHRRSDGEREVKPTRRHSEARETVLAVSRAFGNRRSTS